MKADQDTDKSGLSLAKEIGGQIFVWIGIVGGALTIVNHWRDYVILADWVHGVVEHFSASIHDFWHWLGSLVGISAPIEVVKVLSFVSFFVSLSLGAVILAGKRRTVRPEAFNFEAVISGLLFGSGLFLALLATCKEGHFFALAVAGVTAGIVYSILTYSHEDGDVLSFYCLSAIIAILISMFFGHVINLKGSYYYITIASFGLALIMPFILTPPMAMAKRVIFLLIGVAVIFGLSEASKKVEKLSTAATALAAH